MASFLLTSMRNEAVKLSLVGDDAVLYREDPKSFTKGLLELTTKFNYVEGYSVITPKSIPFLYINNEFVKKKIRETIPIIA